MALPDALRKPTSYVLGEEVFGESEEVVPAPPRRLSRELDVHLFRARELLRQTPDTTDHSWIPSSLPAVDRLLGGGLWRGELTELRGRPGSGRLSLVLTFLATATALGEAVALIDLGDSLDAECAEQFGVDLSRLLWARPRGMKEALAATEIILASALPLVVVELGSPPLPGGRGLEAGWLRLARLARQRSSALLVSAPYRVSGTAARAVYELRPRQATWRGTMDAPRLLTSSTVWLWREKSRRQPRPEGMKMIWGHL